MKRMVKKLVKAWLQATDEDKRSGKEWYALAREKCRAMADRYGVSHETAAGVVAALSPRLHWSRNLTVAEVCLSGKKPNGVFRANLAKAEAIRSGSAPLSVLSGPKVRAFYAAIMGDDNAAVVDVWVTRVVGWNKGSKVSESVYERIATALATAAKEVGATVCELQASVWVAVRGRAT